MLVKNSKPNTSNNTGSTKKADTTAKKSVSTPNKSDKSNDKSASKKNSVKTQHTAKMAKPTAKEGGKKKLALSAQEFIKKIAKIDNLPKNVRESIPFRGIMNDGIIETYPGTFTKTYKLDDVNFNMSAE